MMELLERRQGSGQTLEIALVRRQAEAQQVIGPLETPAPDVLLCEPSMQLVAVGAARHPEQPGSTDNRKARGRQHGVELARPTLQRA